MNWKSNRFTQAGLAIYEPCVSDPKKETPKWLALGHTEDRLQETSGGTFSIGVTPSGVMDLREYEVHLEYTLKTTVAQAQAVMKSA